MKILLASLVGFIGLFTNPGEITTKNVNIKESTVLWTGHKVLGKHNGTIGIKSGSLDFEKDQLVGGEFVIDMSSIAVSDLEGEQARNLAGHLGSPDFFNIGEFPTANFKITKVTSRGTEGHYKIMGDLTIKGITNSISFNTIIDGQSATASTAVDRSLYDVQYGSGSFFDNLGDKTIYDEFDIEVNLIIE